MGSPREHLLDINEQKEASLNEITDVALKNLSANNLRKLLPLAKYDRVDICDLKSCTETVLKGARLLGRWYLAKYPNPTKGYLGLFNKHQLQAPAQKLKVLNGYPDKREVAVAFRDCMENLADIYTEVYRAVKFSSEFYDLLREVIYSAVNAAYQFETQDDWNVFMNATNEQPEQIKPLLQKLTLKVYQQQMVPLAEAKC